MLMPDELQNLVPVISATTMPAPPAMAALSSSPIRSALVTSISAGMVTTTTGAREGIRCLERPISKLTSGDSGRASYPRGRGLCAVRDPADDREPAYPPSAGRGQ